MWRGRKGRPTHEKEKSSRENNEGFAQAWEAVSRRSRQDRGLGRTRLRRGDAIPASAFQGQDRTMLDAADGARTQGLGPERLENGRLQTTEAVRGARNRLAGVTRKQNPKRKRVPQ